MRELLERIADALESIADDISVMHKEQRQLLDQATAKNEQAAAQMTTLLTSMLTGKRIDL